MSSLNLVPDPQLIVAQTGIFLANMYVVNKFIIQPYVKLRDSRNRVTEGFVAEAKSKVTTAEDLSAEVSRRVKETLDEVQAFAEQKRAQAAKEKQDIVSSAKKTSEQKLLSAQDQIQESIQKEHKKLKAHVDSLALGVFEGLTQQRGR